jgi:UDP-glucose 4-epimerase
MARAWVLGAGGMLGGAVVRDLRQRGEEPYRCAQPLDWRNAERLRSQLRQATADFLRGIPKGGRWEIYWAAGVGAMGASTADLKDETAALQSLVSVLQEQPCLSSTEGAIGFASSAGAIYSACQDFEITESSVATPLTDYARAKLEQERLLQVFASSVPGLSLLAARFSTLYGPGQAFGKRQGLLSHIARCALTHRPVEIFVPLDTARDYLFTQDAAADFVGSLWAMRDRGDKSQTKIIAAERSVTISEVVSTFNRLLKRRVRIVCNRNSMSRLYAPRIAYRSIYPLSEGYGCQRHTLIEGAAALLCAERLDYIASAGGG